MLPSPLLQGACDLHVHFGPDVVPRAMDAVELAEAARGAGMADIVLKDHCGCTAAIAWALDRQAQGAARVHGAIALNPPVGGLNPCAVEAGLRRGVDVVFFPTYAARHQIATMGPDSFPAAYSRPKSDFSGLTIFDPRGRILPQVVAIVDLVAAHDAVLATGHLSPEESLALVELGAGRGVRRTIVTHASEPVPDMSVADQREAVARGALVEHSFMAVTECCPRPLPWGAFCDQLRAVGPAGVVLSSDFGQPGNGPPVEAFGRWLERLREAGFAEDDLRTMVCENPRKLLGDRRNRPTHRQ